jgi:hypothetical protein
MKKTLLLLLLLPFLSIGQVSNGTETEFEALKITNSQTVVSPVYLGVVGTDGTIAKNLTVLTDITKKAYLSTGLVRNGLISINADPTKYNVASGVGIVADFTNPDNPTVVQVNFSGITGKVPTYLNTGNITYIAVNASGTIVESATPFTTSQRRSLISLGAVIHSNLTTINVANNISDPVNASTNQLHDLMDYVGALNLTGNVYSANGANLSLDKSAGTIFKKGVNFVNDWTRPHEMSQGAGTALTFRYRTQNGSEGSDVTVIDPTVYDLNNVLTTIPNNKYSIQTVTMFQTGLTRLQYGQNYYDSFAEAKAAISTRAFNVESNIALNGITRAYIVAKKEATSLQTSATAEIFYVQKFGGISSGGAALTSAAIIAALGYTPENIANKDNGTLTTSATTYPTSGAVKSAVDLKANDADAVHKAGTETITGSKNFSNPPTINSFSIWHNGNSGSNLYAWSASVYSSNSAANSDSFIFKNTSQVGRWVMLGKNSETGSNIGYDFVLSSRDDTGSFLSDCLFIKRSTGNIGIGNNSANLGKLQVSGNIAVDSGNEIRLYKADNSDWATIKSDAATTNLNLNSVIKIQNAAGVNSMFPMANGTTDLGTASLQYRDIYITGSIKGASIPLKYTALISQSGTSAPTAIVLDNTLVGTVVWTRNSTGVYFGTLSGAFTVNKSVANIDMPNGTGNPITRLQWVFGSTSVLQISSKNSSETLTDGILSSAVIKIEVYP